MSAPQYPVGTIWDMALIPDEALPRFLAELPAMLQYVNSTKLINEMLEGVAEVIPQAPIWVDDGKRDRTVTVTSEGEEVFSITATVKGDA